MARKMTGNPVVDCKNAYNAGYKEGGEQSIIYARHFAVLAIYNIVQNFVKSEKKQLEMVKEFVAEQNRIYGEEFYNDKDTVLRAMAGVERIYKEIGLTKDGYDEEK